MNSTTSQGRAEELGLLQRLVLAGFLLFTALFTLYFWLDFFILGGVRISDSEVYLAFERAFPAADAWMASSCFIAGVALLRRSSLALLFSLSGGSALTFLGLMDVLFNIQQDIYLLGTTEVILEAIINAYSLTFGPFLLIYFWRHRENFLTAPR